MNKRPPRFVFTHICVFNDDTQKWEIYEQSKKLGIDPKIRGTPLASGETIDESLDEATKLGIKHYTVKVLLNV